MAAGGKWVLEDAGGSDLYFLRTQVRCLPCAHNLCVKKERQLQYRSRGGQAETLLATAQQQQGLAVQGHQRCMGGHPTGRVELGRA
jgi:hypothetical protein